MHEQWNSSRRTLCTSQQPCQFRNAKFKFAMPISNSQCQLQFRNANTLFICLNLCEISQCQSPFRNANSNFAMRKFRNAKFRNAKVHFAMPIPISQCENFAMRNFAMPKSISHCEIHCLCEIYPAKFTGLVILCN